MAGRGTDIVLGGNLDFLADKRLRAQGLDPVETPEEYEAAWHEVLPQVKAEVAAEEAEEVIAASAACTCWAPSGTSRGASTTSCAAAPAARATPASRGSTCRWVTSSCAGSTAQTLESLLNRLNLPDDVPIEAKMVTRAIKSAQTQVEQQNFEIRKNVLKYDEVMNKQRKVIYDERRRILDGENLAEQVHHMLVDVVTAYVDGATAEGYAEDWDLEKLWTALKHAVPGRHRPPRPDRLRRGRRAAAS